MSARDDLDGPDGGRGRADVPRVPVGAGAWGTSSEEALALTVTEQPTAPETAVDAPEATGAADSPGPLDTSPDPLDTLDSDLLHESAAWRRTTGTGDAPRPTRPRPAHSTDLPATATPRTAPSTDLPATGTTRTEVPGTGARASRAAGSRTGQRRSGVDPVKVLMHRHRELCERAVDPLEIAAGLEAHGLTDRAAAHYRHKDVFSLAEEMYARMPRDGEPGAPATTAPAPTTGAHGAWAGLALLPGAVCALALLALRLTTGTAHLAVAVTGALALAVALRTTLRHGPLRAGARPPAPATRLWVWSLLLYTVFGDGLLNAALAGGPDETWAPATAPLLALAVAVAPATWCARLFAAGARRRLAASRGLADFTSSVRPLLLGCVLLFTVALAVLLAAAGAVVTGAAPGTDYAGAGALGVLLLLARLLGAHGRTHAPAVVLGVAAGAEILAVATVFAARLPGCAVLGVPVESAVDALGAGVVPGTVCAVAALLLLVHVNRTLTLASAHARTDDRASTP
ncbi:hypothetical protein [Streptomyces sp. NPDC088785]|uniref:hypothetical protein n=1 Tax=Streptomyces sp. NPDC088785 TaxID=3365897 RepID=UPI0038064029